MSSASPLEGGGAESGNQIGPYLLTKEIGKGSFAVVFQAKVRPVNREDNATSGQSSPPSTKVAVKIVTRRKLTPKLLENLEGEINILRAVRHVNIVELIDCLKNNSHIYLVMQYCRMGDLSNYIRTRKRGSQKDVVQKGEGMASFTDESYVQYPHPHDGGLNADVTRSFLAQLSAALQFMRARDIVHRDIKPQNLLLQEPEAELTAAGHPPLIPQVKVADFGFARHLEAASLAETLCGSPLYMAPEILRYVKYDAKADLWSVGAVLYEMCVGKPPFRAANHVDLLRRIDKEKDKIKFPDEKSEESLRKEHEKKVEEGKTKDEFVRPHVVDDDLKILIRSLLKRHPVERMNFEAFFNSSVILKSALPGAKEIHASASSLTDKLQPIATRVAPAVPGSSQSNKVVESARREKGIGTKSDVAPIAPLASRSYFKPKYIVGGAARSPTALPGSKEGQMSRQQKEPDTTKTTGQEPPIEAGEASSLEDNVLETPGSSMTHLPSSIRPSKLDQNAPPTPTAVSSGKITRGTNSLMEDEDKGYVIVEKRNVEVNALADEIADAKMTQEQRGPWGALNVVRRPSRLGRIASGLGAVALSGAPSGSSPISSTSPTSPRQPVSSTPAAQRIAQIPPTSSASPRLASPPLNAPFAIPSGARRPSFHRRRSSQNTSENPARFSTAFQQSLQQVGTGALVPSSAPTTFTTISGSPNSYNPTPFAIAASSSSSSSPPPSALTRALSMASIRLFGVPTGMSLRSANIRRSLRLGLGAAGYLSSSPNMDFQLADPAEQNLLNLIHDYGQKSFVLSEFADSKLSIFFSEGPHQNNHQQDVNRQGGGSSSSSSINALTITRPTTSSATQSGSYTSEMVAAEALVLYVKSLSFLQRGIDATRSFIEARSIRSASTFRPSSEINDAVQWLRAKFNDGYERANFAKSKASEEIPESAQHIDKMIFDKALEIARSAALEELGTNRTINKESWDIHKCLLKYETASNLLSALLDPGEEAMELSEASAGTTEKFIQSIHKRMASLQRSQDPTASGAIITS